MYIVGVGEWVNSEWKDNDFCLMEFLEGGGNRYLICGWGIVGRCLG